MSIDFLEEHLHKGRLEYEQERYTEACSHFEIAIRIAFSYGVQNTPRIQNALELIADIYVQSKIKNKHENICMGIFEFLESIPNAKSQLAELYTNILLNGNQQTQYRGVDIHEAMLEPGRRAVQLWTELHLGFPLASTQMVYSMYLEASTPGAGINLLKQVAANMDHIRELGETTEIRKIATQYLVACYGNLANLCFNQNLWNQAIEYYTHLQSIGEYENDRLLLVSCQISLGNTYMRTRRYSEAIEEYKKGQIIAESLDDHSSLAQIHKGLSSAFWLKKNLSEAETELKKTEHALQQIDDGAGVFSMWMDLAMTYEQRTLNQKAINCYDIAKKMAERLENMDAVMDADYKLGLIFYEQKDWSIAREHFRVAHRIASQRNHFETLRLIDQYLRFLG